MSSTFIAAYIHRDGKMAVNELEPRHGKTNNYNPRRTDLKENRKDVRYGKLEQNTVALFVRDCKILHLQSHTFV